MLIFQIFYYKLALKFHINHHQV